MTRRGIKQAIYALLGRRVTFNADGLISFHGVDFTNESRFINAYKMGVARYNKNTHIEWRVRVALWAALNGMNLEGDFVECGVNTGILSGTIVEYLKWPCGSEKKFFLLDTFEGVPMRDLGPESVASATFHNREYKDVYDIVSRHFSVYSNVVIVRGSIPDTLSQVSSKKVAYLSIDLNVPEPEIAAGEFFWPRLVPGAMVVLDDFNYTGFELQRRAWVQFANKKGVDILPLPTGQGLMIRPPHG